MLQLYLFYCKLHYCLILFLTYVEFCCSRKEDKLCCLVGWGEKLTWVNRQSYSVKVLQQQEGSPLVIFIFYLIQMSPHCPDNYLNICIKTLPATFEACMHRYMSSFTAAAGRGGFSGYFHILHHSIGQNKYHHTLPKIWISTQKQYLSQSEHGCIGICLVLLQ